MRLEDLRALVTAHADTCLDPSCWRLKHALDGAEAAEAQRLLRESVDPDDRTIVGIPPWPEVSWPPVSSDWPSTFPDRN